MMRKNIISFAVLGIILLVGVQAQPAYAQSFFDDFANIFTNLQLYFESVFNSDESNKQDVDIFRALGETISDWTDDFDEEKKLLKEQKIQNEIELEKRQKELDKREQQLQAETLAKEQKQRELDQRQQQLEAQTLAKEQKQRELDQKQQQLDAETLAKEEKQREIEEQERLVEYERLAKEQKQRELEQQQRQQEAERLQHEKEGIIQSSYTNPVIKGMIDGKIYLHLVYYFHLS